MVAHRNVIIPISTFLWGVVVPLCPDLLSTSDLMESIINHYTLREKPIYEYSREWKSGKYRAQRFGSGGVYKISAEHNI